MRYLMRQKYFSLRDKFTIKDENGYDRYVILGKYISIGKKFSLNTMNEQQIFYIRQKLFRLFPTFVIEQNGQKVATYKTKFGIFRKKAQIISDFGDYKMRGNVFAWDFDITCGNNTAMQISKKILRVADTYTVDINRGYDDRFMLCIAVIIDAIYQRKH